MSSEERISFVKRSVEAELLGRPGVHTVGIGAKLVDGKPSGELAIHVFVRKKRPLSELSLGEDIPSEIAGIKTDVIESPPAELLDDRGTYRPVRGGTQIVAGGTGYEIGTLGCLAWTTDEPAGEPARAVALSNRHVLIAASGADGSDVGQPAPCNYGGCCNTLIGKVLRHAPANNQYVDGAIAILNPGTQWMPFVQGIGIIKGTHSVTNDDIMTINEDGYGGYPVRKRGRTTGLTDGSVLSVEDSGTAADGWRFTDQLIVASRVGAPDFSAKGDSGSVVVNHASEVVGLLWSGAKKLSFATPIAFVEDHLRIRVATAESEDEIYTVPSTVPDAAVIGSSEMPIGGGMMNSPSVRSRTEVGTPDPTQLKSRFPERLEFLPVQGAEIAKWLLPHVDEIRGLIAANPRVAAAWRRCRGADAVRPLLSEPLPGLPTAFDPHALLETLKPLITSLRRYGSPRLGADLEALTRLVSGWDADIPGSRHGD